MTAARTKQLKPLLEALRMKAAMARRVEEDPVSLVRRYARPEDQEVAGLFCASLAYGRVDLFKPVLARLLASMGSYPSEFCRSLSERRDFAPFAGLVYRFNLGSDLACLAWGIGEALKVYGSLEGLFLACASEQGAPAGPPAPPGHCAPAGPPAPPGHCAPAGPPAPPGHCAPAGPPAPPGHYAPAGPPAPPGHCAPAGPLVPPGQGAPARRPALSGSAGAAIKEAGAAGIKGAGATGSKGVDGGGEIKAALAGFTGWLRTRDFTPVIDALGPPRALGHLLPDATRGGASKRLLLYLRWMARGPDEVDLGVWRGLSAQRLIIPVDTHVSRMGRNLGLTRRRDLSWQTAEEITSSLRLINPDDPVSYDFALCHFGMSGECPARRVASRCARCELLSACRPGTRLVRLKAAQSPGALRSAPLLAAGKSTPRASARARVNVS